MIDLVTFGALVSAGLILMAWSCLYRTTILYNIAENLFIGLYLGFSFSVGLTSLYMRVFAPILWQGKWLSDLTILLVIGILYYTRLFKGMEAASRIPMAILAGIAVGVAAKGALYVQILGQLIMKSVIGGTMFDTFNNLLIVVLTFTSLSYMIYTHEHKLLKISARIGRLGLMAAFGWIFGTFLMSVINFAVGQAVALVSSPGVYLTLLALALIAIDITRRVRSRSNAQ